MIPLLLLAAGQSSRMRGADKVLQSVRGRALLRLLAERGLAACGDVYVTLPMGDSARAQALDGLDVTKIPVKNAAMGMSESLKAGVAALPDCAEAVIILPADMPEIESADLAALIAAHRENPAAEVIRATTEGGDMGHPILFTRRMFAQFETLTGDKGAAKLAVNAHPLPLNGNRARRDLDTPEEWLAWRRDTGIFS